VSSGGAADDTKDLARGRAGARAGQSSGAREQVKSEAAWELHCRATAESAVDDHPGFVPEAYLEGLGTGTAVLVAELCSAGVWEQDQGGYRILDRDAVSRCQDLARQLSGEAARVRARIRARDHARAQLMPEMARAMVTRSRPRRWPDRPDRRGPARSPCGRFPRHASRPGAAR
jgi:hypothetical protein